MRLPDGALTCPYYSPHCIKLSGTRLPAPIHSYLTLPFTRTTCEIASTFSLILTTRYRLRDDGLVSNISKDHPRYCGIEAWGDLLFEKFRETEREQFSVQFVARRSPPSTEPVRRIPMQMYPVSRNEDDGVHYAGLNSTQDIKHLLAGEEFGIRVSSGFKVFTYFSSTTKSLGATL